MAAMPMGMVVGLTCHKSWPPAGLSAAGTVTKRGTELPAHATVAAIGDAGNALCPLRRPTSVL